MIKTHFPACPMETTTAAPAAACTLDQYDLVGVIGKGSFGTVSRIRRKADGRIMVWKELNYGTMREKEKQLVVSEVNILRELRHPHIVRYYDRIIDKAATKLYIVMEYCEGGDLGAVIKKARREGGAVEEDVVWKVLAQITAALKECHRHREAAPAAGSGGGGAPGSTPKLKPILHRDLKPGNIFLDGAQNVKIGDFGLAKELASESKFAYTNVGTPFYMSPEMINEMRYNEKSDIWALGCLVFELCALVPPFEAQNQLALAVKINAGKFNRIPARYSEDLYRAIRWMLQVDSTKRPTVEELEKIPRIKTVLDRAAAAAAPALAGGRVAGGGGATTSSGGGAPAPAPAPATMVTVDIAALARREAECARREAECARREAECTRREALLRGGSTASSGGGGLAAIKAMAQQQAQQQGIPTVAVSLASREYSSAMVEADPSAGL